MLERRPLDEAALEVAPRQDQLVATSAAAAGQQLHPAAAAGAGAGAVAAAVVLCSRAVAGGQWAGRVG